MGDWPAQNNRADETCVFRYVYLCIDARRKSETRGSYYQLAATFVQQLFFKRKKKVINCARVTYIIHVYRVLCVNLYTIYIYVYTLRFGNCVSPTRLIDRVSNAQIKYILMNGHFSDGKCSRRRMKLRADV